MGTAWTYSRDVAPATPSPATWNTWPVLQEVPDRQADHELMQRVANGDEAAAAELYDRFINLLWSLARKMLRDTGSCEDAVQAAFEKLWRTAGKYDPAKGSLETWVAMIGHRATVDKVRSERRHPQALASDDSAAFDWLEAPDDTEGAALATVHGETVRAALEQLPPAQREALELAYFGGHTQSEVAELLEVPLGTVKTRTFHGLTRLRELLLEFQGQEVRT